MLYLKLLFFDMMLFYVFWLYDDPSYDKGNYKCDQSRDTCIDKVHRIIKTDEYRQCW